MGNCLVLEEKNASKIERMNLYDLHRPVKKQTKETGAVRIKLVISKQELKEILEEEGLTFEGMMHRIQKDHGCSHKAERPRRVTWKPDLESISEVHDHQ